MQKLGKSRTAQLIFQTFYFIMWIFALLVGFVAGGFLFMLVDRLLAKKENQ